MGCFWCSGSHCNGTCSRAVHHAEIVHVAMKAIQEQCAEIAERHGVENGDNQSAYEIADAIRSFVPSQQGAKEPK